MTRRQKWTLYADPGAERNGRLIFSGLATYDDMRARMRLALSGSRECREATIVRVYRKLRGVNMGHFEGDWMLGPNGLIAIAEADDIAALRQPAGGEGAT